MTVLIFCNLCNFGFQYIPDIMSIEYQQLIHKLINKIPLIRATLAKFQLDLWLRWYLWISPKIHSEWGFTTSGHS